MSFSFSFIKKAGLELLINDIKAAFSRGARGKIITSTYQNFAKILQMLNPWNFFESHE